MSAFSKYVRVLVSERSTLVGAIMVIGAMIGWDITSETASHVEDLLLGIVNVVGVANMLLPDNLGKLRT